MKQESPAQQSPAAMATLERTLESASERIGEFARLCAEIGPLRRGVRDSEALFVYAAGSTLSSEQIVESGRYLGRSTYIYGRAWPDRRIVSIEWDRHFEGADEALALLQGLTNVHPLFGDARIVLPELTLPGDVVVIDGPKDFRALRLANRVMRLARPAVVFIHDVNDGTPMRRYLERHVPWAFYSDHPEYMEIAGRLDQGRGFDEIGKGGTYACIPARPDYPGILDTMRAWGR